MKMRVGRNLMLGSMMTLVVLGIGAAVLAAGGIVAWEYSNSNAFCTNVCHAVHPEEPKAHAASFHARVNCVECHMGRMSTLELMMIKPTHIGELWGMIVGYERPIHTHSLRPARESCEACHWPEARHNDTMRVKYRYADDAKSTEIRTTLQLHTGTGAGLASGSKESEAQVTPGTGVAKGIHWHIAQDLEYVALDPGKQKIPLIEVRDKNGKVTATYFDATAGVSRADADKMPKRRVDCIDCHNAAGHPFGNPANLVDDALEEGRIDRSLPSIKARSDAIIAKAAAVSGPEAERAAKFADIIAAAAPQGGDATKTKDAEQKFAAEMKRILLLTSFAGKDLTWKTFPNNVGHKDFPGCFRCHDGKHTNDKRPRDTPAVHALPRSAERRLRKRRAVRRFHGESRPHSAVESRRAELDARPSHAHGRQLRDVPRQDPVGHGRRELLLQSGVPWAQVAGNESRCPGCRPGRCRETRGPGQARCFGQDLRPRSNPWFRTLPRRTRPSGRPRRKARVRPGRPARARKKAGLRRPVRTSGSRPHITSPGST